MQRLNLTPRSGWQSKVESVGLTYHTPGGAPYWDESVAYRLNSREIDALEKAGNTLHGLYIRAAEHVIQQGRFGDLGIPKAAIPSIVDSWNRDDFSLYGRFDLAYDGEQPPKLLEYNADTPTALIETAVAQWYWLEETHPGQDQFNSIHERLIAAWRRFGTHQMGRVCFSGLRDSLEDSQTVLYLQDTAHQAGLGTGLLAVEDIGFDRARGVFVDLDEVEISACFKLYPWEWMWADAFAEHIASTSTRFLEPAWKMLLSNKAMLSILWELFPDHPNLLPAYPDTLQNRSRFQGEYVLKPWLSREGANITFLQGDRVTESTGGDYGRGGHVIQAAAPLGNYHGYHPVYGVWIVDHEACGLGIREDRSRITGNGSRFVPHFF